MVWVEPEPVSTPALTKFAAVPDVSSLSEALSSFSSVVITGGSSGIGKSFINLCAKLHPELLVCNLSRRAPHINPVQLKLRHFPCDLSQSVEISQVALELETFLTREAPTGRILLINNSGCGTFGPFPHPGVAETLVMSDVNVRAVMHLTGLLLPLLKARGGVIVNVASTAAFLPSPYTAVYAATKAFVLHWSLALNDELRGTGLRTLAFCPGTTKTDFFNRAGVKPAALEGRVTQTSDDVAVAMLRAIGSGRAQAISGFASRILMGFGARLPKPLAARLAGKVTGRFWRRQVNG
ncbi:MAG: SDR family NAD(P)-dependent oxidoreductase [Opitutaceae bacterium]